MLMTFLLCIVATAVGVAIVKPSLQLMRTPDSMLAEATEYLTIYFAGIAGLLIYNMGSAILRAVGDSRRPLYFLVFSAVVNTVLDLLFVICFHMGVAGVAYATIIAQAASAVLVLYVLTKEKASFGLRWNKLRIDGRTMKEILLIGLPASIQQGLTSFSNVFVQAYINDLGDLSASGWAAYNRIDMFLMVPTTAIGQASTTFVAQNWGAQQPERIRRGIRTAVILSSVFAVCVSACVVLLAAPLLGLFLQPGETEILQAGVTYLRIAGAFYVGIGGLFLLYGLYRAVGRPGMSLVLTVISLGTRVALAYALSAVPAIGVVGIWWSIPIGWALADLTGVLVWRRAGRKLTENSHPGAEMR